MTGATTLEELLSVVQLAEQEPCWDSVWVGDSILAKPRLDSLCLLSALAATTHRVRIGVACLASAPLRHPVILAYQWNSLDVLSKGRTIFCACMGTAGPGGGDFVKEFELFGIDPSTRAARMEDAIHILRLASLGEEFSYAGTTIQVSKLDLQPYSIQRPVPIWVTSNPDLRKPRNVEAGLRRVARLGDGWMVGSHTIEGVRELKSKLDRYAMEERGAPLPPDFVSSLYYNINVGDDRAEAEREAAKFLGAYYDPEFMKAELVRNVAVGDADACRQKLLQYEAAGINYILLRLLSYDQVAQFERVTREVVEPLVLAQSGIS
jgi:alkanesulfonate monooxygenase SsuD/methylene tetrahydromethanopterin reductase-like flavin-dependent oxidoreductase (luciferase family)